MQPREYKLKTIVYTYIVGQMLQIKERQQISDVFFQIDVNRDGRVSLDEVLDTYVVAFGEEATP